VNRKFLLDTNVISEFARPRPNRGIVEKVERHELEVATAAPVWHELFFGCALLPRSKKRSDLEAYLGELVGGALPILAYDAPCAEWHGEERARLVRLGRTPPFVDGQIAAIAHVHGLEIVTVNLEDFEDFEGVRAVDWRS
jgi:tRNA(fMet)-specific endonuclease VapC